jgi:hypothetical protein
MSRVRPALAVLLLVVASVAAALAVGGAVSAPVQPGDDPVVGTAENTSRVLLLTRADAATFEQPGTSVTNTLAAGEGDLTTSLQFEHVSVKLEQAQTREARRAILANATDWSDDRVAALRQQEAQARAAYADGEIDATQYVLTLGSIHRQATGLEAMLGAPTSTGTLYAYAEGFADIRTRISQQRARLVTVQGPVRERIAQVAAGERERLRVHVTAGDGVMLSTIAEGQYYRETYRPDNVDETLSDDPSGATSLAPEHYPWTSNHSGGPSYTFLGGYAFRYAANHEHGRLTAYIDTSTERVYVEHQRKSLAQLPPTFEYATEANNTSLQVSRTYAGGPLLIRAENATGDPIDTRITLGGDVLGTTGSDGELWALGPAGTYEVATVRNGATLNVTVQANPEPPE